MGLGLDSNLDLEPQHWVSSSHIHNLAPWLWPSRLQLPVSDSAERTGVLAYDPVPSQPAILFPHIVPISSSPQQALSQLPYSGGLDCLPGASITPPVFSQRVGINPKPSPSSSSEQYRFFFSCDKVDMR